MPSPQTPTHALPQPPARSDENWVVTAVAVFLVASLVLLVAGYQYLKYSQQQEQNRQERQTYQRYNDYLKSSQEPAPSTQPAQAVAPSEPAPAAQAASPAQPSMAQKLLSHPAVTPGPGFDAPGVQQTGVTIINAMDHAQSSARPH